MHPRWPIQRTQPITLSDLYQSPLDLKRPDNLQYQVVYNDTLDRYIIGNRMGSTWLSAPIMLTPKEYLAWTEQQQRNSYFRKQNDEIYNAKGKEKFDFTDMHFDLGPAEKIFGPGGIRVRTQGTAELKFGINKKSVDNPSLPIRNRKTTMMEFDEKINLNVNGKVGDKVNMNLNYNTDATFDYDAQNMKLKYDGKEDEIIKLVAHPRCQQPLRCAHRYAVWQTEAADRPVAEEIVVEERVVEGRRAAHTLRDQCGRL